MRDFEETGQGEPMSPEESFVRRWTERFGPVGDDEIPVFLAWLQGHGPDEWHRWATAWNWDYGTELLRWIVSQPDCDRGTALSVYFLAQPEFYTRFATLEEARSGNPGLRECVELCELVCTSWERGSYGNYAYRPDAVVFEYLSQGLEAMRALADAVPWQVPDGLAAARVEGEPNAFERTIDGIPAAMIEALDACRARL